MSFWMKFDRLLTPRRLKYPWIAGGMLWLAWLVSILVGPGNMDMAGQVVGTDYLQFYAAGETLRQGQSSELYNFEVQSQLQQSIAGPELKSFHAFITPPFFAWLFVPFSLLPYTWSFLAWALLSLLFLWMGIKLLTLGPKPMAFPWALTWFPVFSAVSFGQNSLLSLLLFSLTYWSWRKDKYLVAGLISSLLLFKPQMVLGIGILWLLGWRQNWKSLLGLALGGLALVGLSFGVLPKASLSYLELARDFLPRLIYGEQFPLWHMHSLRGFWLLLFPAQVWLAEGLSLISSIAGIAAYILFWRRNRTEPDLLFAGAVCLTIWITPHAMIYDWSILLIAAILFWQARPNLSSLWKPTYGLIWMAAFLSGPFTYGQLKILPFAFQASIPAVFIVFRAIFRSIKGKAGNYVNNQVAKNETT
jgi:alpha-1,2-mannosyltransferase